MYLRDGSYYDTFMASSIMKKYNVANPGKDRYAYKKRLINYTSKNLKEHWDAVTLVARFLFNKKKITYSKLKSLLTKKSKNKEFWKDKFSTAPKMIIPIAADLRLFDDIIESFISLPRLTSVSARS